MSNTVINTNVAAINSHRSMKIVGESTSKSSEKLSSGLRINRAADDAAGLAISEKMRSQIRGLTQASRNSQDGISLIQTAEGALQETEDMLQRMRELIVQGANDSNEQSDRDKIALELDELIDEIDATASKTEFNKKKLIDGSWENLKLYFQVGANRDQSIEFNIDKMDSTALGVSKQEISDVLNGKTLQSKPSELLEAGATHTIDTKLVGSEVFNDTVGTYEFANGATLTVNKDGSISLKGEFYDDQGVLVGANKLLELNSVEKLVDELGSGSVELFIGNPTQTGGVSTKLQFSSTGTISILVDNAVKPGDTSTTVTTGVKDIAEAIDNVYTATTGIAEVSLSNNGTSKIFVLTNEDENMNDVISYKFQFSDSDKIIFLDKEGRDISDKFTTDVSYSKDDLIAMGLAQIRGENGITMDFAGRNADNSLGIPTGEIQAVFEAVSFASEKSSGVSVGKEISRLTDVLDSAIEQISSQRAKLGAYQNRMEHTIRNLDTSAENLSAAESRIRDTDMAQEMMKFTKSNVLSQAAMSMLAQANQAPNNVLSLLR